MFKQLEIYRWLGCIALFLSIVGWYSFFRLQYGNFRFHEASKNDGLHFFFIQLLVFPVAGALCVIVFALLKSAQSRDSISWGFLSVTSLSVLAMIAYVVFFVLTVSFR